MQLRNNSLSRKRRWENYDMPISAERAQEEDWTDEWKRARLLAARPKRPGIKILLLLIFCGLLALCVLLLSLRHFTVTGASMEPTLMPGDVVSYVGFTQVHYRDVVIFDAGDVYGRVIKRVVGLPGDTIEITADGHLLCNGTLQDEPYLTLDPFHNSAMAEITVAEGKLFVLGDNRANSIDSRDVRIGQISLDSVRGVVTRVIRSTK